MVFYGFYLDILSLYPIYISIAINSSIVSILEPLAVFFFAAKLFIFFYLLVFSFSFVFLCRPLLFNILVIVCQLNKEGIITIFKYLKYSYDMAFSFSEVDEK